MSDKQDIFDVAQGGHRFAIAAPEQIALQKSVPFNEEHLSPDFGNESAIFSSTFQLSKIADDPGEETVGEFLERRIKRCRKIASTFGEAKRQSDWNARRLVFEVGVMILSPRFDLEQACEILGCKISSAVRRNPSSMILRSIHPDRDPKVISKQSVALAYAIEKCERNVEKLAKYFEGTSIKQCLRDYRESKKASLEAISTRPKARKLVLEDMPADLTGQLVIRVDINNGKARFLGLLG
jgi:hypothetical protein